MLNVTADREPRRSRDSSDWKLSQKVLMAVWGPCNIDLLAARHNLQLPDLFSLRPDLQALAVDALTGATTSQTRSPIHPDREEPAEDPGRPGNGGGSGSPIMAGTDVTLLHMLVDSPRVIPLNPPPISNPMGEPHPLADRLRLAAWKVCGNQHSSRTF